MAINPKSVEFHQCHAKRNSISFATTISKITTEIFENTDSDLKEHALHYANDYLYASDFPFKNFRNFSPQTCRNNTKKCLGK